MINSSGILKNLSVKNNLRELFLLIIESYNIFGCHVINSMGYKEEIVEIISELKENGLRIEYSEITDEIVFLDYLELVLKEYPMVVGEVSRRAKQFKDVSLAKTVISVCNKYNPDNTEAHKEIIEYLNLRSGFKYRYKTKAYAKIINGRLADGYFVDDFKRVIDNKVADWKGSDMEKFLRPSTLFAPSHFDEYLNEQQERTETVETVTTSDITNTQNADTEWLEKYDENDLEAISKHPFADGWRISDDGYWTRLV